MQKVTDIALKAERDGVDLAARLIDYAPRRPGTRLSVEMPDGRLLYTDPAQVPFLLSEHTVARTFTPAGVTSPASDMRFRIEVDVGDDAELLARIGLGLLLGCVVGACGVGLASMAAVRRHLKPLDSLARQLRCIQPDGLGLRIGLPEPAAELQPWVEQFNSLMARLEQAYLQLENFNADVAHELRTPLGNLVGQTEVALARERPADDLRDTLQSNLEELHRLSGLVHDMLFLSRADRGVGARRSSVVSLSSTVAQVVEFHEASLDELRLRVNVCGDAEVAVDEALIKRAMSNLLANAARYAEPCSEIRVVVSTAAQGQVTMAVENRGPTIAPGHLPRLFDRFFRVDTARQDGDANHGLGLAIVAAIARMHAGQTFASSSDGVTTIGFSVARA